MIIAPAGAQSRKAVKQAKKDTKLAVSELKADGYKSLDNVKLDDAVNSFLTSKYSTKSAVEVIGKGVGDDLNEAKAEAREDAIGGYPDDEVVNSFYVYKKTRKRYEVVCYAVLKGRSAKTASKDRTQIRRRSESTESSIDSARREQERKEAKAKEKKELQKAKQDARKAEKKAQRQAEKAEKAAKAAQEAASAY